ncbi:hypothetical protein IP360_07325 [Helicobacter winghamensis]|uniref:hypothetical protein n=1 Tax=Helicobacter winghamensis TaxID=157268 RepID=UPI0027A24E1C
MEFGEIDGRGFQSKRYGISWVAYVKMSLVHLIFVIIVVYGAKYFFPQFFWKILLGFGVFELINFTLRFLSLRAQYVFMNERGVWFHRGIFPWTKGVNGIIWNDCGGAMFQQGFWSYLLKTYTVFITHKYTESAQIAVSNIYNGKEFCAEVADYMHKMSQK